MANINIKPGPGRTKGIPNKTTTAAKEAFQLAFDKVGGFAALAQWAERNRTEFYKLYGRLIPVDVKGEVVHYTVQVVRFCDDEP